MQPFRTIFLTTFFFLTIISFAQIPSNTKSIKLVGDSTTTDKIIASLVSNGYNIKDINKYSITTDVKRLKSWSYDINVSSINNIYTFSIYWNSSISLNIGPANTGPSRETCSFKGMNSNANKVGFNDLNALVQSLGYPITYIQ
jgi:hypothetical protein